MRKLLLLSLLFIGQLTFTQDLSIKTDNNINITEDDRQVEIRTPMPSDMSKYTTIALVNVKFDDPEYHFRLVYDNISILLQSSSLIIKNPRMIDTKRHRTEPNFLRETKKSDWLYLYLTQREQDEGYVYTLILRDYQNKLIYSAVYRNSVLDEVLLPIIEL